MLGPRLQEVYRCNSNFGQLQVIQSRHGSNRYLLNDYLMQGAYDTGTRQGILPFLPLLHILPQAYCNHPIGDVLCIGLGAGLVPMPLSGTLRPLT